MKTEHPANEYMVLVQPPAGEARVEYYYPYALGAEKAPEILFRGGRIEAKRFLRTKSKEIGWENVPQYCRKKSRRKIVPKLELITYR